MSVHHGQTKRDHYALEILKALIVSGKTKYDRDHLPDKRAAVARRMVEDAHVLAEEMENFNDQANQ